MSFALLLGLLAQDVGALLRDLESPVPETRSAAEAKLRRADDRDYATIRAAAAHPDPEVRGRIQDILRRLKGPVLLWERAFAEGTLRFPEGRMVSTSRTLLVSGLTPALQPFDPETGTPGNPASPFDAAPYEVHATIRDDAVYAAAAYDQAPGRLAAVSLSTGRVLWSAPLNEGRSPLVVDGKRVYLLDGRLLCAHECADGRLAWSRLLPEGESLFWSFSAPVLEGGRLYAGNVDSGLHAFDAGDGRPLWTSLSDRDLGGKIGASFADPPSAGWGVVVSRSPADGRVAVVSAVDGAARWDAGNKHTMSALLSERGLYVVQGDAVALLDLRDGKALWTHALPKRNPEFSNGPRPELVGERDGVLYLHVGQHLRAVDISSNTIVWEREGYGFSHQTGGWRFSLLEGDRLGASGPDRLQVLRYNTRLK